MSAARSELRAERGGWRWWAGRQPGEVPEPRHLEAAAHGVPVTIAAVSGDPQLCQRLLELGFTPGHDVTVLAAAPFGGPLAVACRGTIVALRRQEAACLLL